MISAISIFSVYRSIVCPQFRTTFGTICHQLRNVEVSRSIPESLKKTLKFDVLAHNTHPNIKIRIFFHKYSIIFNVTANAFLCSVYLDRNDQIYHDKGNHRNCYKRIQFLPYRLCVWIVPGTWYLSSHLVFFFFPFSLLDDKEEQFLLCNQSIIQVVLPGFFISLFQSTGCQSSPLQGCSRTLHGTCRPTTYKPYQASMYQHHSFQGLKY